MGIGGGVMNTPILRIFGYPINVIGTSAAIGFLIAVVGTVGFVISGKYLDIKAPFSLGFVYLPAFLIFVPITTFMAQVGAKVVHKVDKNLLGKFFGVFLCLFLQDCSSNIFLTKSFDHTLQFFQFLLIGYQ